MRQMFEAHNHLLVRWLSAFNTPYRVEGNTLLQVAYEFSRPQTDEVCAEAFMGLPWIPYHCEHVVCGLLVNHANCIRVFKGDVWSVKDDTRCLYKTRKPADTDWQEAWVYAKYSGIVLTSAREAKSFMGAAYGKLLRFAKDNGVPVYELPSAAHLNVHRRRVLVLVQAGE